MQISKEGGEMNLVRIGFLFGVGIMLAYGLFNLIGQVITILYTKYLVKKLKKNIGLDKPKDMYFGKDGKIL